mmetsp:Transcript_93086/g.165559  ORF Transcript_93086/g.165559 Transcript_93086/m.165559 type:complete len:239 (+) Transcript_93086:75-791(+)
MMPVITKPIAICFAIDALVNAPLFLKKTLPNFRRSSVLCVPQTRCIGQLQLVPEGQIPSCMSLSFFTPIASCSVLLSGGKHVAALPIMSAEPISLSSGCQRGEDGGNVKHCFLRVKSTSSSRESQPSLKHCSFSSSICETVSLSNFSGAQLLATGMRAPTHELKQRASRPARAARCSSLRLRPSQLAAEPCTLSSSFLEDTMPLREFCDRSQMLETVLGWPGSSSSLPSAFKRLRSET